MSAPRYWGRNVTGKRSCAHACSADVSFATRLSVPSSISARGCL